MTNISDRHAHAHAYRERQTQGNREIGIRIESMLQQVRKQHAISEITVCDLFLTAGSREDGLQSGKHNEIGRNTKADRQTQAWPGRQR